MTFETFPIPERDAMLDAVEQRVAAQDEMAGQLISHMGEAVGARLQEQAQMAGKVQRKLTRAVNGALKKQQAAVDALSTAMMIGASQRVVDQQNHVNALTSRMLGAGIPTGRSGPTARGTVQALGPYARLPTRLTAAPLGSNMPPAPTPAASQTVPPPAAGPVQGGPAVDMGAFHWYVECNGLWGVQPIGTYLDPDLAGFTALAGPWYGPDALEQANAWILQNFPDGPGSPCGGDDGGDGNGNGNGNGNIGGNGGGGGGPPPDCPEAPWFLLCANYTFRIVQATGLSPGDNIVGGPYADRPSALSAMSGMDTATVCGVPPPPPQPMPPPDKCLCPIDLSGLPDSGPPGSPEWCAKLNTVIDALEAVGDAIINIVQDAIDLGVAWMTGDQSWWDSLVGLVSAPAAIAKALVGMLKLNDKQVRDWLCNLYQCWRALADGLLSCRAKRLLPLVMLKGVIDSLNRMQVGINWPIKLTVGLVLDLPAATKLLDYCIATVCPSEIPQIGDVIGAYLQGQYNEDMTRCLLGARGVDFDVWSPVIMARAQAVSADQVIEYVRRLDLPPALADQMLKERGWCRDEDRGIREDLYDRLPTEADITKWRTRTVIGPAPALAYNPDEGWSDYWTDDTRIVLTAQGVTPDVARQRWRSHWSLPGEGQARDWVHRLRPEVVGAGAAFGEAEYAGLLSQHGWPGPLAAFAVATLYAVPSRADVIRLIDMGLTGPDRLPAVIMSHGYDRQTAALLAQADLAGKERSDAGAGRGVSLVLAAQAARVGLIKSGEVAGLVESQLYQGEEIDGALQSAVLRYRQRVADRADQQSRMRFARGVLAGYQQGTVDASGAAAALSQAGWMAPAIATSLGAIDLAAQQKMVGQALSGIRRAYLGGELTDDELVSFLGQAGIQAPRLSQYVQTWKLERTSTRQMLSTSQTVRLVREGLLSAGSARSRLKNIGWQDPDLLLLFSEISQSIAKAEAAYQLRLQREEEKIANAAERAEKAALLAAERAQTRAAKEAAAALRAAEAARLKAEATLRAQEPVTRLRAWYLDGIITADYVRRRMAREGYATDTTDRYLVEWDEQRAYRAQKTPPPAPV